MHKKLIEVFLNSNGYSGYPRDKILNNPNFYFFYLLLF